VKSIFFSENTPKIPQKIFAHHGSNFKKHRISQNCDFDGFKKEAQLSPRDPLDAVALSVEVLSTNNGGGLPQTDRVIVCQPEERFLQPAVFVRLPA